LAAAPPGQRRNDLLPTSAIESVSIVDLKPPARNVRRREAAQIREVAVSIGRLGFSVPVLVGSDNVIPRLTPLRRATSEIFASGSKLSATIRVFSSRLQLCRRATVNHFHLAINTAFMPVVKHGISHPNTPRAKSNRSALSMGAREIAMCGGRTAHDASPFFAR
jgi:hypothetical protein